MPTKEEWDEIYATRDKQADSSESAPPSADIDSRIRAALSLDEAPSLEERQGSFDSRVGPKGLMSRDDAKNYEASSDGIVDSLVAPLETADLFASSFFGGVQDVGSRIFGGLTRTAESYERLATGTANKRDILPLFPGFGQLASVGSNIYLGQDKGTEGELPSRTSSALGLIPPIPFLSVISGTGAGSLRGHPIEGFQAGLRKAAENVGVAALGVLDQQAASDYREFPADAVKSSGKFTAVGPLSGSVLQPGSGHEDTQGQKLAKELGWPDEAGHGVDLLLELGVPVLAHAAFDVYKVRKAASIPKADDALAGVAKEVGTEKPDPNPLSSREDKQQTPNKFLIEVGENAAALRDATAAEEASVIPRDTKPIAPYDPLKEVGENAARAIAEQDEKAPRPAPAWKAIDQLAETEKLPEVGSVESTPVGADGRPLGKVAARRIAAQSAVDSMKAALTKSLEPVPGAVPPVEPPSLVSGLVSEHVSPDAPSHVRKLGEILDTAIEDTRDTQDLYGQVRRRRAAALEALSNEANPDVALDAMSKALTGELPKQVTEVTKTITDSERIKIANELKSSKELKPYEKKKALSALRRLMDPENKLPLQMGEIKLFGRAIPEIGRALEAANNPVKPIRFDRPVLADYTGLRELPTALDTHVPPGGAALPPNVDPGPLARALGERFRQEAEGQAATHRGLFPETPRLLPEVSESSAHPFEMKPVPLEDIGAPSVLSAAESAVADKQGIGEAVKSGSGLVTISNALKPGVFIPKVKGLQAFLGGVNFEWLNDAQAKAIRDAFKAKGVRTLEDAERALVQAGFDSNRARAVAAAMYGNGASAASAAAVASQGKKAPAGSAEEKLISAVGGAPKVSADRAGKILSAEKARTAEAGLEFDAAAKGRLFDRSFEPVGSKLSNTEKQGMIDRANTAAHLTSDERALASGALKKVFNSDLMIPPNDIELVALNRVYPELAESLYGKRQKFDRFINKALPYTNLLRSIQSAGDMSLALRQAAFFVGSPEWAKAFYEMHVAAFSEGYAKKLSAELNNPNRKNHLDYKALNLVRELPERSTKLSSKSNIKKLEFQIEGHSSLTERAPSFIGDFFRGSNRAAWAMLNKMRADLYDNAVATLEMNGEPVTWEQKKNIARMLKVTTGEADLDFIKNNKDALGMVFYSPSLTASRFQMMDYRLYSRLPSAVRNRLMARMGASVAILGGVMGATVAGAKLMGVNASIGTDPTDAEFGKGKFGDTRWDVWAGHSQNVRLFSALLSGYHRSPDGIVKFLGSKTFGSRTFADELGRYIRSKASPNVGIAWDYASGKTFGGQDTSLGSYASYVAPMAARDIVQSIAANGLAGALIAPLTIYGQAVSSYHRGGAKAALEEKAYSLGFDAVESEFKEAVDSGLMTPAQVVSIRERVKDFDAYAKLSNIKDIRELRASIDSQPKEMQEHYQPLIEKRELEIQYRDLSARLKLGWSGGVDKARVNQIARRIDQVNNKLNHNPQLKNPNLLGHVDSE